MTTPTPDYTSDTGTGIQIPSLLPQALSQVVSGIATGITEAGAPDPISLRRRWAVVTDMDLVAQAVNINLGGVPLDSVPFNSAYKPVVGDTVMVDVTDTDMLVQGTLNFTSHAGTIDAINLTNKTVNVTLESNLGIDGVPYLSPYFPTLADVVEVQHVGDGYVVLGAYGRTFRRPTGDIEASLLASAKTSTLICNGQTVSRSTYGALWAWAQLNNLVGNASTTSWTFEGGDTWSAGSNWTQTNSTGRAHSGTRSLLFTRTNASQGNGYVTVSTAVQSGYSYVLTFWTYASAATNYGVSIDVNGSRIAVRNFTPTANTWEQQSIAFSVPAGITGVGIFINDDANRSPTSGGTLNIDDVVLSSNLGRLFSPGDGSTTFSVPDLRGRVLVGAGLSSTDQYNLGDVGGRARTGLQETQMPPHTHAVDVNNAGDHNHAVDALNNGNHNHSVDVMNAGDHDHTVNQSTTGDHDHTITQSTTGGHWHFIDPNTEGAHEHRIPMAYNGSDAHHHASGPQGWVSEAANDAAAPSGSTAGTAGGGGGRHGHGMGTTGDHNHSVDALNNGNHNHSVDIINNGDHDHTVLQNTTGDHDHTITQNTTGDHDHLVNQNVVGGVTPVDVRQPFAVVNWLIWV